LERYVDGLLIVVSRDEISDNNLLPAFVESMQRDYGDHGIDSTVQADVNGYILKKVWPRIQRFYHSPNNTMQPTAFNGSRLWA
jgi:hypothetical protein